jgi:hypothetical protein
LTIWETVAALGDRRGGAPKAKSPGRKKKGARSLVGAPARKRGQADPGYMVK